MMTMSKKESRIEEFHRAAKFIFELFRREKSYRAGRKTTHRYDP
jgi:hypothetical protein